MKRQKFRLKSVLRHYELQKRKAEQDLHQASMALREIDDEITGLNGEIVTLAGLVCGKTLSTAGWLACSRRSEHLGRRIDDARVRRERQATVVARCAEARKRWAIAEETLESLKHRIETANDAEETKSLQVQLQESILRRWLVDDASQATEL